MRVVFAGTPEFSMPCLEALIEAPCVDVVGVYTQPDRPTGRGKKIHESSIKTLARTHALAVFQPVSFKQPNAIQGLAELNPDLMVVTAYGLLLPQAVLDVPGLGCVNIHASLLPRWRGAAPIQRAIEAGDVKTGITLMQIQLALDSGPILAQSEIDIDESDTSGTLHDKLSLLGGGVLKQNLAGIRDHALNSVNQDIKLVTHAAKLSKSESKLDWEQSAITLFRKIRAFNPWPMMTTIMSDSTLRVLQASYRDRVRSGQPGEVVHVDKSGILVQTGDGTLNLEVLQKPGGKALAVSEFLNGIPISVGMRFGSN